MNTIADSEQTTPVVHSSPKKGTHQNTRQQEEQSGYLWPPHTRSKLQQDHLSHLGCERLHLLTDCQKALLVRITHKGHHQPSWRGHCDIDVHIVVLPHKVAHPAAVDCGHLLARQGCCFDDEVVDRELAFAGEGGVDVLTR